MIGRLRLLVTLLCLVVWSIADAAPRFDVLYGHYAREGARDFSAERGRAFWTAEHSSPSGERLSCASCHGGDLRLAGKHNRSGKSIEPMAPSINKNRYADIEKTEKWFLRNCKQVLKRECTAQEKGDVIRYLSQF